MKPKSIEWHELDGTEKELDAYIYDPGRYCHSFLVLLRMRYECDLEWVYSREILLCYGETSDGEPLFEWFNDWHEGQEIVEYLAVADLEEDEHEDH